jgi:hypothetical protein
MEKRQPDFPQTLPQSSRATQAAVAPLMFGLQTPHEICWAWACASRASCSPVNCLKSASRQATYWP